MAERIETFDVTIPAGTAIASAQTTALNFNMGVVQKIEILIPPGPSGLVGFRIRHSAQTVIPHSGSGWIIADDEKIEWPLENFPVGNKWTIQAYNTDVFPHTLYLRFLVAETRRNILQQATLVPIAPGGLAEDFS